MGNKKGSKSKKGEDIINNLISGAQLKAGQEVPPEVDLKLGSAFSTAPSSLKLGADVGLVSGLGKKNKKKPILGRTFNQNVGSRPGFHNEKGGGRSFGKGNGEGRGPGAHIGKVGGSKEK